MTADTAGPATRRGGRNLSKRHAEILVLLQSFPDGLATEQLALMLSRGRTRPGDGPCRSPVSRKDLRARWWVPPATG